MPRVCRAFFRFSRFAERHARHRTGKFVCVSLTGFALSITASAERLCCAPYGRHTLIRFAHPSGQPAAVTALRYVSLLVQERCAKEGHPRHSGFAARNLIRFAHPTGQPFGCYSASLRFLVPAPLRGPAYMGHPWPNKPLAASMRLVPLHDTSTRPPDGTGARACEISTGSSLAASVLLLLLNCGRTDDAQVPFRRPSGIAM